MSNTGTDRESVEALQALGFSELEAAVYAFLLRESPATGYRIAHAIGKAKSNTYKAIATLEGKGAVIIDDGETRLCRAVPPTELLGHLEHRFRQRRERAEDVLQRLERPDEDERVYQLRSRDQVLERARQMLRRSREVALAVAFPAPLAEIHEDLEAAAARGVRVLLKVYQSAEIPGVRTVLSSEPAYQPGRFPGQELNLVVDAEEYLVALLGWDGESVVQATWSGSPFLAFVQYNGLFCEWILTSLAHRVGREAIEAAIDRSLHPVATPGFRRLVRDLPGSEPDPSEGPEPSTPRGAPLTRALQKDGRAATPG